MKRLFDQGANRIKKELNIIKIIRELRDFQHFQHIFFTKELIDKEYRHGKHNVIFIDDESEFIEQKQYKK
jgi:hypothetical protein